MPDTNGGAGSENDHAAAPNVDAGSAGSSPVRRPSPSPSPAPKTSGETTPSGSVGTARGDLAREVPGAVALLSDGPMGSFDETGAYVGRQIVENDLTDSSLEDAIAATIVEFDDGDIVQGKVVKIDQDEVLLDIGFKSEGVIPVRELSIRNDVDPSEIVSIGDSIEALVPRRRTRRGA